MRPYCPGCGVGVETELSLEEGQSLFRCANCGFVVEVGSSSKAKKARSDEGDVRSPSVTAPLNLIVAADDSATVRKFLVDNLESSKLAKKVHAYVNGEQFVQAVAELFLAGSPIDLVILDVGMPILNGYGAAIVLRAMERAFRISPTPVLFLSARACDETFKKALQYCAPARYLNKAVNTTAEQMIQRLSTLVGSLQKS